MSDEIKLACWVQGDDFRRVFSIQVKLSDTALELRQAIRAEKSSFKHLSVDALDPRKVSELYWHVLHI
jgi:Crinkler effector protein N-terminal domain